MADGWCRNRSRTICGKNGYRTYRHAMKVVGRAEGVRGEGLRIYRCPECGHWHLTSRIKEDVSGKDCRRTERSSGAERRTNN